MIIVKIDDKEIKKFIKFLQIAGPRNFIPKVMNSTINDYAFATKKNTIKTTDKAFDFKNSASKNYIQTGVAVQKAKKSKDVKSMEAIVGVKSGNEDTRKFYKRNILTRQEKGGVLRQVKGRSGFRKSMMIPTQGVQAKKVIRFKKAGIVQPRDDIKIPKRRMAAAIKDARRLNKKYAVTPYGIYRVLKRRARLVRAFVEDKSIRTPKNPWLIPAVKITSKKADKIFYKNLNRQLKKVKFK